MKNGTKSSTSGLLDGDLDISISDAIENLTIDLKERYLGRSKFTPDDISEITNPNLIAKDDASAAFSDVEEATIPKIMIDTSNVTSMNGMFYNCKNLETLDLSNLNTSNVTFINHMFSGCQSLVSLDLSNFDTSKVRNMNSMFENCTNLEILDLSNFDTSKVTKMSNMFNNCNNLKYIIINNPEVKFKCSSNSGLDSLPQSCKFLVPKDSIEKYKNTPEWSNYKDRIESIENYEIKRDNGKVSITDTLPPIAPPRD